MISRLECFWKQVGRRVFLTVSYYDIAYDIFVTWSALIGLDIFGFWREGTITLCSIPPGDVEQVLAVLVRCVLIAQRMLPLASASNGWRKIHLVNSMSVPQWEGRFGKFTL